MSKIFSLLLLLVLAFPLKGLGQAFPDVDPVWDSYYNSHPTTIRQKHQASDFIDLIAGVEFVPRSEMFRNDVTLLKRGLLMLGQEELDQMAISGDYAARSKKHYDYFLLYNSTYNPIQKVTWDLWCPYLLPLMHIDNLISID